MTIWLDVPDRADLSVPEQAGRPLVPPIPATRPVHLVRPLTDRSACSRRPTSRLARLSAVQDLVLLNFELGVTQYTGVA